MAAHVAVKEIHIQKVINNACNDWDELAHILGFKYNEIHAIRDLNLDQNRRCREMLDRWRNREGSGATLQVLKQALIDIDQRQVAESLNGESDTGAPSASGAGVPSRSGTDLLMTPPGYGAQPVVLMLNDEYGTSKGGISTIHRQTARFLASKGAKVYSTVLQANQKDKDDAAADGVQLIFPETEDDEETPNLKWLTRQHLTYYPRLPSDVEFIVGHVNITSRAAKRIKEDRLPHAKLAQVTHVIPEDTSHYKGTEKVQKIAKEHASILEDLKDASAVVSVGPRLHDYYTHQTKQDKQLKRVQILPKPSDIFSDANMEPPEDTDTRVVLSIGRVKGVERLKGYDLSARSMGDVMEELPNTKWRLCGIIKGDFEETQEIVNANTSKFEFVPFTPLEYCTQEKLCEEMGRADVVLMPSRAEPFGLVGLEAIAAGVPTVVSSKSGLAEFLKARYDIDGDLDFTHPIIEISGDDREDAASLTTRIVEILKNRSREFKVAKRLKQKLLDSKYWEESHRAFLQVFGIKDFQQMLGSIFSRLDEADVRPLRRVWWARTDQQESALIETPQDLKKAMVRSGYITTGNLGLLEKDMMAAGISFPVIMRDIPGVPDEFQSPRTTEVSVGPVGGKVEISGFVSLIVPPRSLQRETTLTVSIVDIPGILRGEEGVSWTSGYPWSLDEDAYPRELLDQVLFSPAVDVNLHGEQLDEPVELETWRPEGSEGMRCILLKHQDGEGWIDITASTMHQMYSDKVSISLQTFSPLEIAWVPVNLVITTGKMLLDALKSRTLNCSFAAYVAPDVKEVELHVVCRDRSVGTDDYLPGFTKCGQNYARSHLYHGDVFDVTVSVRGGNEVSRTLELRAMNCCDRNGESIQIWLDRPNGPNGGRVKGEVTVKRPRDKTVCQLTFKEADDTSNHGGTGASGTAKHLHRESGQAGAEAGEVKEGHIKKVIKGVSNKWEELADELGFSDNDIGVIRDLKRDDDRRCREMLTRWRNKEGRGATLQVLKQALIEIDQRRIADSLHVVAVPPSGGDTDGPSGKKMKPSY